MTEEQSAKQNYRGIMKGTAIFGGVQVFQILVNIVRGKFVAMFLGPEGMGIMSLFTSTTNTINQFTGFGLQLSAIKDISQANEAGDMSRLSRVTAVFRRLTTITGLLAAVIALVGAPWLSELTFGTRDYTWGFMALAIMLFFTAKATAETSLLQGTRHLKSLAKSTLIGAVVGLVIGVPLYALFGTDGIVPSMIAAAVAVYFTNRYFTSKINLENRPLTTLQSLKEGRSMISLGVVLMVATLIGTIAIYALNIYIRWTGSAADVGLYQAAASITNQYVGLVFAAMAVDYLPRLMGISADNKKVAQTVSRQIEIVMLVVAPLIITIIVSAPLVISILLTDEFTPIIPLMLWLALGLVFKSFSYPIGYIAFAKGDKRVFFWLEGIVGNVMNLSLSVLGYTLYGLIGLGVASVISFVVYIVIVSTVARIRYDFRIPVSIIRLVLPIVLISVVSFVFFINVGYNWWSYCVGVLLIGGSVAYSYYQLNRLIGIKDLIMSKFSKKGEDEQQ